MFYAAQNNNRIGTNYELVSFMTKGERTEFQRYYPSFESIASKDAQKLPQFDDVKRYPHSIIDEFRANRGVVLSRIQASFTALDAASRQKALGSKKPRAFYCAFGVV